ncbi:MAG: hypothetical protein HY738_07510 [Bacteroidia bacterium]|nr:hypothetical protein [Bacteroidia bacterium]
MTTLIFEILIIHFLLLIAYQDFKYRAVSWFLLPVLFVTVAVRAFSCMELSQVALGFAINAGVITFQLIILTAWFSLKERKQVNIFNRFIGLGDILFFFFFCLMFSPVNFVLLMTGAMSLILLVFGSRLLLSGHTNKQIPLAGAFSIIIIVLIIIQIFIQEIDFYDDSKILKLCFYI